MNKAPTKAERAAVHKAASPFSANQSLSDIIRLVAGHAEAKQDVILGAVHSAYYQALKHGNKAQLQGRANSLYEQAKMYSTATNAKAAGFAKPQTAATVYAAHLSALDIVGIPGKASADQLVDDDGNVVSVETLAEGMALAYMDAVTAYVAEVEQAKADKRAASKAAQAKAAPSPEAVEAVADAKEAAAQANSVPVVTLTMAEMVAAVAAALRTGTLDADLHNQIADAAAEYSELEALREQVPPALAAMTMPAGEVAAALAS